MSSSAKKLRGEFGSRSGSKGKKARADNSASGKKEYVALRNHNISKDYTMQELDRITTLNSIKEHVPKKSTRKEQTDQDKKRSVSVKVKNDLGRKSTKSRPKELRNKSFDRDHSGASSKRGPLSTQKALKTDKNFAFSPATGSQKVSLERKRKPEAYESIKTGGSPINLTNQQAYRLNETSSTRAGTQNPFASSKQPL